ncbi:MAG: serine/threonine-protein kinase, partial [Planctomycetota bacterium]|nr:serine/threonine-protein kinase [Planctomycetota bacterium]
PANMILSDENVLKIMDFGLARSLDVESGLTAEGAVVGTIHYLAPEVARGEAATAQSDLYSLGVALYEMLTSRVPFDEESPLKLISRIARETPPPVQAWRDDLPPAVAAWLHKMLASDVEQRYQTAQDALADLARISYQSFPLHDPLRQSDGASTVEITPTPVAGDPAKDGKKENRPLTGVKEGDIDAIISEALRIEKEGREVLHEDSLMEIAAEVGVSAEAVRAALRERQEAIARQQRRQKIIRIAVASAAALVILAFILAVALRPTPKAPRTYQMAGRGVKDLGEKNSPLPKPNAIAVDEKWREVGLSLTGNRAILAIRVIEGKEVECRVGDSAPFTVEGAYYGAPGGEGALLARAPAGAAKIAAAALAPLRMAAMPFSASETGSAQSNLADGTGDLIATRLAERKCFEIVERVQVQKILANLNLENTKHFDPKTAGRIGRMLGVDYLITGAVQEAGGRYRLSAKRLAAETGEVLENAVLDGTDIFALQDRLAQELVQKIQATELARFLP